MDFLEVLKENYEVFKEFLEVLMDFLEVLKENFEVLKEFLEVLKENSGSL